MFRFSFAQHRRHAVPAALFAWLAILLLDWRENAIIIPKGHAYSLVIAGSFFCFLFGIVIAAVVRSKLIDEIRRKRDETGALPSPSWVFGRSILFGLVGSFFDLPGYFGMAKCGLFRVLTSFVIAGLVGGAWIARSIIVREYPERTSRPWSIALTSVPAALVSTMLATVPLVFVRFRLDHALEWATRLDTFCGPVESANLTVAMFPYTIVVTAYVALVVLAIRSTPSRAMALGLGAAALLGGALMFAFMTRHQLLASPPNACRNTPWPSTVDAIAVKTSLSYAHEVLLACLLLVPHVVAVFFFVASRRAPEAEPTPLPEKGPYRTSSI